MPFLITFFPLIGGTFLAEEWIEWMFIGISVLLGVGSLCMGYHEHQGKRALAVPRIGLTLVVWGRFAEEFEAKRMSLSLMVVGGCTLAIANLINRKLCLACRLCQEPQENSS
jgi:hypothetical protein